MSIDGVPPLEMAHSMQAFDERTAWLNEMSALRVSIRECGEGELRLKEKHQQRFNQLELLLYPPDHEIDSETEAADPGSQAAAAEAVAAAAAAAASK